RRPLQTGRRHRRPGARRAVRSARFPHSRRGTGRTLRCPAAGAVESIAARLDRPGDWLPPLEVVVFVDLHLHSTASDGSAAPEEVVRAAHAVGLRAIALTDHDTLDGIPAAIAEGERLGIRVVSGCEFSVAAPWGELHLLGYFLPLGYPALDQFLV